MKVVTDAAYSGGAALPSPLFHPHFDRLPKGERGRTLVRDRLTMATTPSTFPWKRNLAVLWVAQVLTTFGFSFTFPFYPIFFEQVGVSDPERAAFLAGVSGGLLGVGMGLFAPIWGTVGDRFGRRLNIIRALFLGALFLILSGYAQNGTQLVVSRFFVGATSGVVPTIMALVAAHTPKDKLALASGATMSALLLGTAFGPLFGGVIFDNFGMRAAFWATGIGLLVAAALVIALAREEFRKPARMKSPWEPFQNLWKLVGNRSFMPVLVMVMMMHAGMLMITPAIAGIVKTIEGGSGTATATALVFATIGVGGAISSVLAGWLAVNVGLRRVFLAFAGLAAVLSLGPFAANDLVTFTVLIFVVSLFQGGLGGLLQGMIALKTPYGQHGMAFGASQVAHSVGTALGPLIGGAAVVAFGFKSVFLVNVVLFLGVLVLAAIVVRTGVAGREGR